MNRIDRIKAGFQFAFGSIKKAANPQSYNVHKVGTGTGAVTVIGTNGKANEYITDGYQKNDILYSVVNIVLDKCAIPNWAVYRIKNKQKFFEYQAHTKAMITAKDNATFLAAKEKAFETKEQALELFSGSNRLTQLLDQPNEMENWGEYLRGSIGYKLLTGNKFIYAPLLGEGANAMMPASLNVLPSQYVVIYTDGMFPIGVSKYQLTAGVIKEFTKDEILHEKMWNPDFTVNGSHLLGQSPIQALASRISKNNAGVTSQASAFENKGASGVAFLKGESNGKTGAIQPLEDLWNKKVNNPKKNGSVAWVNEEVGYLNLSISPADLQIIESEKWDVSMICAAYQVPPQLVVPDNANYNTYKQAEKALTTRAALPELISHRDSHNRKIQKDWGLPDFAIDFDMSVFSELQEDMGDMVKWLKDAWWLPAEEKYKIMGKPIPEYLVDNELMQQMFVPNNMNSAEIFAADLNTNTGND